MLKGSYRPELQVFANIYTGCNSSVNLAIVFIIFGF